MKKKKGCMIAVIVILAIVLVIVAVIAVFLINGRNSENVQEYKRQVTEQAADIAQRQMQQVEDVTAQIVSDIEAELAEQLEAQATEQQRKANLERRLKEKYYEILLNQKAEALGLIESLLSQGKADYEALAASGKADSAAKGNLVSQYLAMIDVMEAQMDQSFASTVAKMEEQLAAQGIDPEATVKEYEAEYQKIKEENRQVFMDKALAAVE